MTIVIGATGWHAGEAVFRALEAAEKVGTNSIGGFATYKAILADGTVACLTTQRGGTATLVVNGECTGGDPSAGVLESQLAMVVSSGPDRPEPLEQSVLADSAVGIVSGHRIPGCRSRHGKPIRQEVYEAIAGGVPPHDAVRDIMAENPAADVGIIAIDMQGRLGCENTAKVARRPDLSQAVLEDEATGCKVAVLHNDIWPLAIAPLAAEVALEVMRRRRQPAALRLEAGCCVLHGPTDLVEIDESNRVVGLVTTDDTILNGSSIAVVPYLGSQVVRDGTILGETTNEPLVVLSDGVVVSLSGQGAFTLTFRWCGQDPTASADPQTSAPGSRHAHRKQ